MNSPSEPSWPAILSVEILTMSELDESALQMPAEWPLDQQEREAAIRKGVAKSPLAMNCSGKHAGMIRTTVLNDGDIASYRDPDHPTQLAVVQAIDDLAHGHSLWQRMSLC